MKRTSFIPVFCLLLGFYFEYLHFTAPNPALEIKFGLMGLVLIIVGAIGSWLYIILPLINAQKEE